MPLTAWFRGEPGILPRPVKLDFVVTESSDVADVKAVLVTAVDRRFDQSTFALFLSGNGEAGWIPTGCELAEEQTLLNTFPAGIPSVAHFYVASAMMARGGDGSLKTGEYVTLQEHECLMCGCRGSSQTCASTTDHLRIPLPLSSKPNASGLALTDDGFDEPVGCMPWSGFFPAGRIRDEFLNAARSPAASSEDWKRLLDLSAGLVLMRELKKSLERPILESWDTRVSMWFPPFEDDLRRSMNARPSFLPIPIAIAQSCKVDYLRLVEVKLQLGTSAAAATAPASAVVGAAGRTACAITAVAELKNSLYHPNDGEPQALVAAFSAVIDLHSKGLLSHDCVVPIILNTGILEQHAIAYLIGTAPCAVLTTPVIDLTDAAGQCVIAAARMAFV